MLDRSGSIPLYQQVEKILRERISSGELRKGARVPSEKELRREFDISRDTARHVLKQLRDDNTVYNLRGRGTFVGPRGAPRQIEHPDSRYREIAAELANEIRNRVYQPDRPIPSETHLTQRFDATTKTVRNAVEVLRDQGWVYTKSRKGTYVSDPDSWPQEPQDHDEPDEPDEPDERRGGDPARGADHPGDEPDED